MINTPSFYLDVLHLKMINAFISLLEFATWVPKHKILAFSFWPEFVI